MQTLDLKNGMTDRTKRHPNESHNKKFGLKSRSLHVKQTYS